MVEKLALTIYPKVRERERDRDLFNVKQKSLLILKHLWLESNKSLSYLYLPVGKTYLMPYVNQTTSLVLQVMYLSNL